LPSKTSRRIPSSTAVKSDKDLGEYIVSEARINVFRLGLVGINSRKGLEGTHEPDTKVTRKPILFKVSRNKVVNAGLISRSPLDPSERSESGFSNIDSFTVLANARRRFGRAAFCRTDRL
jgi:hypothetical protein